MVNHYDSLKVGEPIWKFDINRRVYPKTADGRQSGGPIYAEHFIKHYIADETCHSWLVAEYGHQIKVGKKTMRSSDRYGGFSWYSEHEMREAIWENEHKHKIINRIQYSGDVEIWQLRAIAQIIGYDEEAK